MEDDEPTFEELMKEDTERFSRACWEARHRDCRETSATCACVCHQFKEVRGERGNEHNTVRARRFVSD